MKPFFTYEQQLEKLKTTGLIIADEAATLAYLKSEGYYNLINGYSHFFGRTEKLLSVQDLRTCLHYTDSIKI